MAVHGFFYGTLCHPALLTLVLGRAVQMEPAALSGFKVAWAKGRVFPVITPGAGQADGVLVRNLSAEDWARLDFYEAGFAFTPQDLSLTDGTVARVYIPDPGSWQPGKAWVLADWQAEFGADVTATAGDVMALYGSHSAASVVARYPVMLVRGASRVRAAGASPADERRPPAAVRVVDRRQPYANFFAVEEYDLSFARFDGSMSPVVNRAAFVSGDAVTVLPYDPVRDRVLLVEQFRTGPFARGDHTPWQLEAIAGRIDPGETPEDCARREAVEEAGLTLGALLPVAGFYPSPGAKSEFIYSYVALCDLPDGSAGVFGVADEAEDICGHLISFDRLMELVSSGEASNAPVLLSALWLQRERGRLRS